MLQLMFLKMVALRVCPIVNSSAKLLSGTALRASTSLGQADCRDFKPTLPPPGDTGSREQPAVPEADTSS